VYDSVNGTLIFKLPNEGTGKVLVFSPDKGPDAGAFTPEQQWRSVYFGTPDNTGEAADGADGDGDGLTNFVEYALGTSPKSPDRNTVLTPAVVNGELVVSFNQPPGVSGIKYEAQWSASLAAGGWQSLADSGSGFNHVFRIPANGSHGFVRMILTRQ
jgi:hypothetical protein